MEPLTRSFGGDLAARLPSRLGAGLPLLLQGHKYAQDLNRDAWDFAVEGSCLAAAGWTAEDCRWLVGQGYLKHRQEITAIGDTARRFRPSGALSLAEDSCYVLTTSALRHCSHGPQTWGASASFPEPLPSPG